MIAVIVLCADVSTSFRAQVRSLDELSGDAGGIISTGNAISGINHADTRPNCGAASASATDGLWVGVDGEGGTSRDYRAYSRLHILRQSAPRANGASRVLATITLSGVRYPQIAPPINETHEHNG